MLLRKGTHSRTTTRRRSAPPHANRRRLTLSSLIKITTPVVSPGREQLWASPDSIGSRPQRYWHRTCVAAPAAAHAGAADGDEPRPVGAASNSRIKPFCASKLEMKEIRTGQRTCCHVKSMICISPNPDSRRCRCCWHRRSYLHRFGSHTILWASHLGIDGGNKTLDPSNSRNRQDVDDVGAMQEIANHVMTSNCRI